MYILIIKEKESINLRVGIGMGRVEGKWLGETAMGESEVVLFRLKTYFKIITSK